MNSKTFVAFSLPVQLQNIVFVVVTFSLCAMSCIRANDEPSTVLTVYSGRSEDLVGPIIEAFRKRTGVDVQVRYGKTAQMAATILEEGNRTPADVFFAQDVGALGALAREGLLDPLPYHPVVSRVEPRFRSREGKWVGISGRARVVVYNTERVKAANMPDTIFGFCDPKWKGRIGWAPANGSFQAFVTALRVQEGEERAREWLECVQANDPKVYPKNTPIVAAAGAGEIDVGFVNHYYLYRFTDERGEGYGARNHFLKGRDPGALVNVAGVGILKPSQRKDVALQFISFLLSKPSQRYFSKEIREYPLVEGIAAPAGLPLLTDIQSPDIDLSDLADLEGTLQLLQEVGIL